jgi:hypothetical protein
LRASFLLTAANHALAHSEYMSAPVARSGHLTAT